MQAPLPAPNSRALALWITTCGTLPPASAASIAGLKKLVSQGVIDKGETITCVVTGHLLKDPNTAIDACTQPKEVDADIDTLRKILMKK